MRIRFGNAVTAVAGFMAGSIILRLHSDPDFLGGFLSCGDPLAGIEDPFLPLCQQLMALWTGPLTLVMGMTMVVVSLMAALSAVNLLPNALDLVGLNKAQLTVLDRRQRWARQKASL